MLLIWARAATAWLTHSGWAAWGGWGSARAHVRVADQHVGRPADRRLQPWVVHPAGPPLAELEQRVPKQQRFVDWVDTCPLGAPRSAVGGSERRYGRRQAAAEGGREREGPRCAMAVWPGSV